MQEVLTLTVEEFVDQVGVDLSTVLRLEARDWVDDWVDDWLTAGWWLPTAMRCSRLGVRVCGG